MEKRYGVLRFISGFYKVVGIIMGVLTLLSALGICLTSILGTSLLNGMIQSMQNSGMPVGVGGSMVVGGILAALGTLLFGALSALGTYAIGELISLLISLEQSSRTTATLLQTK